MTLRTITALFACGICAASPAELHTHNRFAITADQVAAKLIASFAEQGVSLDAKQVHLPASVSASEELPPLEVKSVAELHGSEEGNTAVKLSCVDARVCLPFYAVVSWAGNDRSPIAIAKMYVASSGNSTQPVTLIKSGAHITLLMENGTTRIKMGVVSMENGWLHRQIRVRTSDHKLTFLAEVLDANTVKGAF